MIEDFIRTYGSAIIATAAIFAVFITDWLNKKREANAKNEQIQSARMLIGLEVDKNIEMLSELWDKVNRIDSIEEDSLISKAYNLKNSPLRSWKNESWKSQISFLPIALNRDEIKDVSNFYDDLDNIKSIHSNLVSLYVRQDGEWNKLIETNPGVKHRGQLIEFPMDVIPPNIFETGAPDLLKEFEKITLRLIKKGNPLNKDK